MNLSTQKVLVIGANGFLGNRLLYDLSNQGYEVHGLINTNLNNITQNCKIWKKEDIKKIPDDFNVIFFVASLIPYSNMNYPSDELFDSNVLFPIEIIKKFKKSKIVFSSSVSVYKNEEIITEQSCLLPQNLYAKTKLIGEYLLDFCENISIVRYSSIYGNGMTDKTFIPKIINAARMNSEINLVGGGNRKQDYIHVADASKVAILASKMKNNDIYLGVNGCSYSNFEIAKVIQTFLPRTKINFVSGDEGNTFIYDNCYTKEKLNFLPSVSINEGIKNMIYG